MANKLYEEDSVSAIATAIRNKNGTSNTYTIAQMAPAIDALPVSRNVVNGIIKQYKANTTTVSADTFVEFVNGNFGDEIGTDTSISTMQWSISKVQAVLGANNQVFIIHGGRLGNYYYLYGVVCNISGTTITAGTDTQLSTTRNSNDASIGYLGNDKFFIAYRDNDGTSDTLYGMICTTSGSTITPSTPVQLDTQANSYTRASVVVLASNKVFISHRHDSKLYGMICTISGSTITVESNTLLSDTSNSQSTYNYSQSLYLTTNKVLVLAYDGNTMGGTSSVYPCGVICSISGNTLTKESATPLSAITTAQDYWKIFRITSNTILFLKGENNGEKVTLHGLLFTVDTTNNTITVGNSTEISTYTDSYYQASAMPVGDGSFFVQYAAIDGNSAKHIYGTMCTFSGTTITVGTTTELAPTYVSSMSSCNNLILPLESNKGISLHDGNSSYNLYGKIISDGSTVKESETKIEGLTKTECTTSVAGEVWVLNQGN